MGISSHGEKTATNGRYYVSNPLLKETQVLCPWNGDWLVRSVVVATPQLRSQWFCSHHFISSKARTKFSRPLFCFSVCHHCCTNAESHTPPIRPHALQRDSSVVPFDPQAKEPFLALVSGVQNVLDACPAMPGVTLETSIQDCLRRPSPGAAAWSLGAARMFVGGVLSLVSRSPRSLSLCQVVVSVLVCFVAEKRCGLAGEPSV